MYSRWTVVLFALISFALTQAQDVKPATVHIEHDFRIRAVSYNIRRGLGMDGETDLTRCEKVLRDLHADFVGLQEVDVNVERSGGTDQARTLGERLSMHAAFGSFMKLQGGAYGMAILSRYPIVESKNLPLPEGNEPRIALVVEAKLPNGDTIVVVNVHFDWVDDDSFRYAQAKVVAEYVRGLDKPFILLGDFNDRPGSRTVNLFESVAREVQKPETNRLTYPSDEPVMEIDFIWCGPESAWRVEKANVVAEPIASDHLPVVADLVLRGSEEKGE